MELEETESPDLGESRDYRDQVHASRSKVVNALLIGAGSICVVLGVVGIVLPVVPTTPFLLLAAICYAHSSERFYTWLLDSPFFGQYIRDWRDGRGLTIQTKAWIVFVLASTMGMSMYFVPLNAVRILLGLIGLGISAFIISRPTRMILSSEED